MSDLRISELPVLLAADAEANDDLAVADYSSSETRRLTIKGAVQQGVSALIDNNIIPGAKLVNDSVTATQIAANAITSSELADNAVDTAAIVDGAVTNTKLATGIDGAKLIADSVTATQIAANAITASELANDAVDTAAIVDLAVTNAKLATGIDGAKLIADSVTATQIAANAITASELADNSVDTAAIIDLAVTTGKLADASVTTAKLASASVTADAIAANAVGASELADNAVDTAAIVDGAVTELKLATASVTEAKLGTAAVTNTKIADATVAYAKLNLLDGDVPGAKLATASVTATQLATNAVTTLKVADAAITDAKIASGVDGAKLSDGTVSNAKLATGIDGAKLIADSVTAAQIAANAITASELADNSVDTAAVVDGAITDAKLASGIDGAKLATLSVGTSQIANLAVTDAKLATGIDGAKLTAGSVADAALASGIDGTKLTDSSVANAKLATGIDGAKLTLGTVAANKLDTVTDRGLDQTSGSIGHTNSITPATRNGITFDAQGHVTGTAALIASDLPAATESSIGGVSVPADSGLTVSAAGELDHANNITADSISGITYDEHGHIVSAVALTGADLPIASDTAIGAISVPASGALTVSGTGDLTHSDSAIAPGVYTKVTVDQKGHATAGATLVADDIPELDASKITTGTFSSSFLAPNSVTAQQLADYGIAQVSESQPTPEFAGQWWINPSDRSAYIWIGTVTPEPNGYWLLVGYGSPTQLNLRFGGTYDATANTVTSLNQYGVEAGLTIGQPLSAPNSTNNGVYLAVTTAGTGTTPAPAVSLAVGDWVLSQGTGSNWTKVAVVSGASGTFNDYDILCDGTYFTPDMPAVADVRDALELIWGRVQIATGAQLGVVKESSEVVVDNSTGEMTLGIVDEGTY